MTCVRPRPTVLARMAAVATLCAIAVAVPASAQAPRATLSIRWTSDSSWEGTYLEKPHRFHVREVLEGRLVFALADSALLPRARSDTSSATRRALDVIQLNENGTSSGATLVSARGST